VVRAFLVQHEIEGEPLVPHLRAIASLCNPNEADKHEEGVALLNTLIRLLRDYVTPSLEFQEEIAGVLQGQMQDCETLAKEIAELGEETEFHRKKIDRITEIMEGSPDGHAQLLFSEVIHQLLNEPSVLPEAIPVQAPERDLGSLSNEDRPIRAGTG
jgi:hypothetical protein